MLKYLDFYKELLLESSQISHKWTDLPDNPPYGFLVYPDGSFGIAKHIFSHKYLVGGDYDQVYNILNKGGVRVVTGTIGDEYWAEHAEGKTVSSKVKRTVEDLAKFYQRGVVWTSAKTFVHAN